MRVIDCLCMPVGDQMSKTAVGHLVIDLFLGEPSNTKRLSEVENPFNHQIEFSPLYIKDYTT